MMVLRARRTDGLSLVIGILAGLAVVLVSMMVLGHAMVEHRREVGADITLGGNFAAATPTPFWAFASR